MHSDIALWDILDEPWRVCLALAWESYRQGSLPIAAVIVDDQNRVVARGRNRLQDDVDRAYVAHALHRHPLAHAEVNALLDFPFSSVKPERCTLLTNLEPCPLCVGAVRMSHIGALVYAARDPWAGVARLFETDAYVGRKGIHVSSLAGSLLETCLIALQTEAHLRGARAGGVPNEPHFFETWRGVVPRGVQAGERLFAADSLVQLASSAAAVRVVFTVIEGAVAETTG